MILIEISGIPVPWKSHGGYGKRSYNPRYRQREQIQWQIRSQWNQEKPIGGPVRIEFTFHMPIPTGTSKIRRISMLNNKLHHIKRPDLSNCTKFLEDCLKEIVIEDDSQVVEMFSRKIYSEKPRSVIKIDTITE
jgi:Holliday junction resolvase RusA-like endonuclease